MSHTYVDCYRYDEDGYFCGVVTAQKIAGKVLVPKNAVEDAPELDKVDTHFFKRVEGRWVAEAKPTTPEECAALGDLPHKSQTKRVCELRKVFETLCKGSTEWRVEQDKETLARRVVAIPQKTEEELKAEKAEHVRAKRDYLIAQTDYLLAADYPIDAESLEAVKAYRQELRDVPQQESFPDVEWPTAPAVCAEKCKTLEV